MQTLQVALPQRHYPIHIGPGVMDDASLLAPHIAGRQVMIVTNDAVAAWYLERLKATLAGYELAEVVLPDGEAAKTLDHVELIWDALLAAGFNRRATLIALGGGVVGDMTGFAAACYQRGVGFIQIPTTLLAQVDASVGGKTGVNHPRGKNMIGAFHQPRAVIVDTDTLATLPARELSAGLAEVIKYGLIHDIAFLDWLEVNMAALRRLETGPLSEAIRRSCEIKADIVVEDETEQGIRAHLNLGHTFGHAIETAMGYGSWLHGEAVGAGMVMAAGLSQRLGWIDEASFERVERVVEAAGLPRHMPSAINADRFLSLMHLDKKVFDARLRLILLKPLGQACITDEVGESAVRELLEGWPRR
ncbi:3-dehydroquinate synthase [Kushneria aurantia]|uniref:3-dehydroquinate synthase n=1 Tax=Kushneria aurantia TaxID=504092 RepID=A0ABV6FZD3_9GAMM|nr:3-dehydroquinate synthase [Kushneria aurantia]